MQNTLHPLLPSNTYHVWTHAVGDENFFRTTTDYLAFMEKHERYISPIADTVAYCLLPNHFHLMLSIRDETDLLKYYEELNEFKKQSGLPVKEPIEREELPSKLSQQVSNFLNSYAKTYNNKYERKGTIFQRPFHRKHIESDEYFTTLIAYIHNNPIHHGFVTNLNDWPHSSWHGYLMNRNTRAGNQSGIHYYNNIEEFLQKHKDTEVFPLPEIFEP